MDRFGKAQCQEAKTLVSNIHDNTVFLAASLKGQLAPAEEGALVNIFQTQMILQSLLDEVSLKDDAIPLPVPGK